MTDKIYELRLNANENLIENQYNHMIDEIASSIGFYNKEHFHIGYILNFLEINNLSQVDNPTGCGCCHDTTDNEAWILELWKDKTKPIESQSYECIEYIYNLIIQNNK